MKNNILFKADSRGYADHGWLKSHHTFSFANYRDNDRIHFGVLRVLNDDDIAAGMGFGTHPHNNMEIISIPLAGDLAHKDSMGNGTTIKHGDIQVMSAGTGIEHSEFNANNDKATELLQIWIFPDKVNVTPRYQQITLNPEDRKNTWEQVLSPNPDDKGVWIHQNAWFHMADLEAGKELNYTLKDPTNGIFLFVIEGSITIDNQNLDRRDALGFWEETAFSVKATTNSQLLVMEIPMELPSYLIN
ncbi:pirin family protein [Myroides guanonis]|uniref:Pirin N-terminal domain-containing protein n=1 Tax=Myroides guanonis TaxID=1150112 RepID=A0A1I3Q465_9FLAO|nr:pirin family protein [Myroides guanonis]SFJ28201.1 hypothetical protein SAMN04487893_10533 [Myroides guanonis]